MSSFITAEKEKETSCYLVASLAAAAAAAAVDSAWSTKDKRIVCGNVMTLCERRETGRLFVCILMLVARAKQHITILTLLVSFAFAFVDACSCEHACRCVCV
jgi:hypothetical protein